MPIFIPDKLTRAIAEAFEASGVSAEAAEMVAEHLIEAELCGVRSHGVIRVKQYVEAVQNGKIARDATLTTVSETASTAVLDGHHGFGQVMARLAMDVALDKADRTGVAAVTLVNCSHTGRLGSYTARATSRGMVGIMMVNAGGHGQWVAPYGGSAGRLATNPLSIAVPVGNDDPIMLDIATSVAPEGKIRTAQTAGQSLPDGWLIDHHGRPSTNPDDLYDSPRGALLPFGGHKGFGLAMIIDALAGGLSGAGCCHDPDAPLAVKTDGVLVMALNVAAFGAAPDFHRQIRQLIEHVKSSPPAPGTEEVITPGELEARSRRSQLERGLTIDDATWRSIQPTLARLGVSIEPSPDR